MGCTASSPNPYTKPGLLDLDEVRKYVKDKAVIERLRELGPNQRYVDPEFGGPSALYISEHQHDRTNNVPIQWRRPTELAANAQLFVDGISRLDIVQGDLGDCWFLCACAAITLRKDIWTKVISADNSLLNPKGLYHFRFWRFGAWTDVYIDDLLPTRDGEYIYAQASDPNEVWPALIEKAYAKVNGCYEALQSGKASEGLLDLTGGLTEVYYPPQMKGPELFDVMRQALRNGAFVACNTDNEHDGSRGLITGHAYSITLVSKVPTTRGAVDLLRVFNPWGNMEWTGDWGDDSEKWREVPSHVKAHLGITQEMDGEFWMSYHDFCQHFARVYICTLGPDFDRDGVVDSTHGYPQVTNGEIKARDSPYIFPANSRKMFSFHGAWVHGGSAGGCSDNLEKYATNPQYFFSIAPDKLRRRQNHHFNEWEEEEAEEIWTRCFLIVSLMQKFERATKKRRKGHSEEYINFRIYKLPSHYRGRVGVAFFRDANWVEPVLGEVDYTNTREVTSRFLLDQGNYVLVPSTFDAEIQAQYLIRLYAWTSEFYCREL